MIMKHFTVFCFLLSLLISPADLYTQESDGLISIIGVGDIMLGTNYPSKNYLPPNNGRDLLKAVQQILKNADVTFGNLEGTLLNAGGSVKKCSDPSKCYAFRMPEDYVNLLVESGFDVVSIANNHSGDFGSTGRANTVKTLKTAQIKFAGLTDYPYTTFEKNGVKFGMVAFAPNSGTVDIRDISAAEKIVSKLESLVEVVIVSFHGGAEGSKHRYVTKKTETFYGENRGNVYQFSHRMIDAGADIVFGHGPHVTRAMELYKNRLIAYSLGNFCTYARFNLKGHNGIAPILKVELDRNGAFHSGKIISIKQEGEGGPKIDKTNMAVKEIIELTHSDFPATPLSIGADGTLRKK